MGSIQPCLLGVREDLANEEVSGLGAPEDMEKVMEVMREESRLWSSSVLPLRVGEEEAATLSPSFSRPTRQGPGLSHRGNLHAGGEAFFGSG